MIRAVTCRDGQYMLITDGAERSISAVEAVLAQEVINLKELIAGLKDKSNNSKSFKVKSGKG